MICTILIIFDLQVTLMPSTKFRVNWPFGAGEEAENRFSRWRPSWISDRNDFSYFWSTSYPDASHLVSGQLTFGFLQKKRKIDFQDGHHDGHLGFTIGMILAIFDLQVIPMLPSKFRVNWPFGTGEEAKNRLSRCCHGGHLGFPIGTILATFDL